MRKIKGFYLTTLIAGFLCIGGLIAMNASDAFAADENPCSGDMARFCPGIEPGPAGMIALMECLETHEKELSPACREFEAGMGGPRIEKNEAMREKREFRQNCTGDMIKFCKDTSPTHGRMIKCLKAHESELTAPCSRSMNVMLKK